MTGHICRLGLKYVTSQRTFCGLYVFVGGNFDVFPNFDLKDDLPYIIVVSIFYRSCVNFKLSTCMILEDYCL